MRSVSGNCGRQTRSTCCLELSNSSTSANRLIEFVVAVAVNLLWGLTARSGRTGTACARMYICSYSGPGCENPPVRS